jgi:thioredoxin 1
MRMAMVSSKPLSGANQHHAAGKSRGSLRSAPGETGKSPMEWEFSMPVIVLARKREGLFLSQSISYTRYPPLPEETSMASELVKHITDATFEDEVLHCTQPILVDYWAEWCGPCKMIAPILDEVSVSYEGKLQVAKMNVDENREIPAKFGIRGIPTLMLFKDGKLAATKVGALSKAQLVAFIDEQL